MLSTAALPRSGLVGLMLVVAAALAVFSGPSGVMAQTPDGPQVLSTQQRNDFPSLVEFTALVENGADVESAILFYTVLPEGALTRLAADLTRGDVARLSATISTNRRSIYIPVGADFEWFWELTTTDGATIQTDPQIYRYEDPRYDWQAVTYGTLSVFYYADRSGAERLLEAGSEVLAEMSALLNVSLEMPVSIYVWQHPSDAVGVERVQSEVFEELVITGGTRVLADLLHVFQPTRWVVRHELTHILTKLAGDGGIGQLPAWLDEGTATYAEGDWRNRRGRALNFAVNNDQLLSILSLGSATNIPGQVDIFYGQSGALVTYLIDEFGPAQFAALFAVFKHGSTADNALIDVYGFDRDALDARFRVTLGLEPRVIQPAQDPEAPADALAEAQGAGETGADLAPAPDASRTPDDVAARREEIDARNATRRPAPLFSTGSDFPWEAVVTVLSGVLLLASTMLFWRIMTRDRAPLATAQGGATGAWTPPPEGCSTDAAGASDAAASSQRPLTWGAHAAPAERPTMPTAPETPRDGWQGWRSRDQDASGGTSDLPDGD